MPYLLRGHYVDNNGKRSLAQPSYSCYQSNSLLLDGFGKHRN
jgi:hypothetical protein